MICKKCGREYDDDMPKCLWCDAPREGEPPQTTLLCEVYKDSPEKLVNPELEQALTDNIYRGKSTISWIKMMMVVNIIGLFVELKTIGIINAGIEAQKVNVPLNNQFFGALFILIGFLLFMAIPLCLFFWKNWSWIYHAQKEQSLFTESFFAPWGAVLCYFLPVVNYFVIKDLIKNQCQTLTTFGCKAKQVSNKFLVGFLIITIVAVICNFIGYRNSYSDADLIIGTITWFIFIICYLKFIKTVMENERELKKLLHNNLVNSKVEAILAQREAEKQDSVQA